VSGIVRAADDVDAATAPAEPQSTSKLTTHTAFFTALPPGSIALLVASLSATIALIHGREIGDQWNLALKHA